MKRRTSRKLRSNRRRSSLRRNSTTMAGKPVGPGTNGWTRFGGLYRSGDYAFDGSFSDSPGSVFVVSGNTFGAPIGRAKDIDGANKIVNKHHRTSRKLRSNRRRPAITSKASKPKKLKMKWPAAIDYDTRVALGLPVHGKKSRRTSSRRSSLRRNAARNHTVVSASHSIVKGASVGITASKRTLVFASKDYDDKGNVSGPAIDVTKIADNAFYVLGYDTPTTPARRAKLVAAATRAAGLRSNSRRRTSRR